MFPAEQLSAEYEQVQSSKKVKGSGEDTAKKEVYRRRKTVKRKMKGSRQK